MNCEKCKNKKATLFYADEGGGRHALCASCGALQGKLGNLHTPEESGAPKNAYLPDITLSSLLPHTVCDYPGTTFPDPSPVCGKCNTSVENLMHTGSVGCPQCYSIFDGLLPSFMPPDRSNTGIRMPHSHRQALQREALRAQLKQQIKVAVENENYELAATLRDKIKALDN